MNAILKALFTLGIAPWYKRQLEYSKIIEDFQLKLPRVQNEAKIVPESELSELAKMFTVLNLETHKTSLSEADIDEFYNRINNFNYKGIIFKKHLKKYTENLNRFNPSAQNGNFNLVMIQYALKKKDLTGSLKPYSLLI